MKTSVRLIIATGILSSITSFGAMAMAQTSLDNQCSTRIEVLEKELSKVLQKKYYSMGNKSAIHRTKAEQGLRTAEYRKLLASLKLQYNEAQAAQQADDTATHRSKIVACLLDSGSLLQKVGRVAQSGGKSLDYFSKNWRNSFPSYDN